MTFNPSPASPAPGANGGQPVPTTPSGLAADFFRDQRTVSVRGGNRMAGWVETTLFAVAAVIAVNVGFVLYLIALERRCRRRYQRQVIVRQAAGGRVPPAVRRREVQRRAAVRVDPLERQFRAPAGTPRAW